VCFCYPRIYGTYLFTLILECYLLFFCYDISCPFPDVHQSVTQSRWVITMDRRPLCTINPSCFLSTCRAADAFILMGSPCAVVSSPPFFFTSYKAARCSETRVVSSHCRYINFKLFTLISAVIPPTIETWSRRCNLFNLPGHHESAAFPCVETALLEGPCAYRESHTLRSRQNARSICCRPINGRTTNNVSHKLFYSIFSFPS